MSDIIEHAEAWRDQGLGSDPVPDLIAALKAARAEVADLKDQLVVAEQQYAEKP